MIPHCPEWIADLLKYRMSCVGDNGCFAMHRFVSMNQFSTKEFANALVAETNTQHRYKMMKMPDQFRQDAGPGRCFGTRRNHNTFWL